MGKLEAHAAPLDFICNSLSTAAFGLARLHTAFCLRFRCIGSLMGLGSLLRI